MTLKNTNFPWNIIKNYFKSNGLVEHQINSFNYFINNGIQDVINNESDIIIRPITNPSQKFVVKFGSVWISPPSIVEPDRKLKLIYPYEARNRDLCYSSSIMCDVTEILYENDKIISEKIFRRVCIGRTPIMIRSSKCNLYLKNPKERINLKECEHDHGGYFIIRGIERVLVAQMRSNYNTVIVLKQKIDSKYSYIGEIRSMSEETGHSVSVKMMIEKSSKSIKISMPYIKELIPIGIIFKALGFIDKNVLMNLINFSDNIKTYLYIIMRDSFFIKTKEEALSYIGQYSIHQTSKDSKNKYAWQVVESELFPHFGISNSVISKALFLGHMVKQLISVEIGIKHPDDRDNFCNKRIETSGILCTELFKTLFKRYINTIKLQLEKKRSRFDAISIINKLNSITHGLKHSFSTGNWGVQKNVYIRMGVCQVMSRMTYGSTISHMNRVIIPIGKEGKNTKIRQIHSSQFGYICPGETPEGSKAGIVLNFSLLATVSKTIPTILIKDAVLKCKNIEQVDNIILSEIKNYSYIFLNGILIGISDEPFDLLKELKLLRKIRRIHPMVSFSYCTLSNHIKIFCDGGRPLRPFFTLNSKGTKLNFEKSSLKSKYKNNWEKLVRLNVIQYLDNSEIENSVIAMTPDLIKKYPGTYNICEIHPSMMLGVMGNIIPFPDHNPSPRNCYQMSMGKQALGIYALSYQHRSDTITHVLSYPQKSLVSTKPAEYMGFNSMPSGINAIVAIMTYTG